MRVLATVIAGSVVAGCSFEPGALATGPDGGAGELGPDADEAPGDGATLARACRFPDPELRLCIELEDRAFSPKVTDASAARLDGQSTDVAEATRMSGYAAAMAWSSRIDVPEAPELDITSALTIEMWIWPAWPQSANLLVNAQQYTLQLAGDGRVGCLLPTALLWSTVTVTAQQWTHIACTYADDTMTVFVNGVPIEDDEVSTSVLSGDGTLGTRIGSGYTGGIDDIRVYARALSEQEVCAHAGRTSCSEGGSGG